MAHAYLSPSGAYAWTKCLAKPFREKDLPEETSDFAQEGIRAHNVFQQLIDSTGQRDLIHSAPQEMLSALAFSADYVNNFVYNAMLYSEQVLPISHITGEDGATGTADVVIVKSDELVVIDLKYGVGVKVYAKDNKQLLMYASAALEEFDLTGDIKTIRMCITQPRLEHNDEWCVSASELRNAILEIKKIAHIIKSTPPDKLKATPGEAQCRFCKAKGGCPEYRNSALGSVVKFYRLDADNTLIEKIVESVAKVPSVTDSEIADAMDALDMVENWCKAVREESYKRLIQNDFNDDRYKLVEGRQGNRKWVDHKLLIERLEAAGWNKDQYTETSVMEPPKLEKIIKKDTPDLWRALESNISRAEAKLTVVRKEDPRPEAELSITFDPIEDADYAESLLGMTKENK